MAKPDDLNKPGPPLKPEPEPEPKPKPEPDKPSEPTGDVTSVVPTERIWYEVGKPEKHEVVHFPSAPIGPGLKFYHATGVTQLLLREGHSKEATGAFLIVVNPRERAQEKKEKREREKREKETKT